MSKLNSLILAGDRGEGDLLARTAKVPCRALLSLGGQPMIRGPLAALLAAESVGDITISEPVNASELKTELRDLGDRVSWMRSAESPSSSVLAALQELSTPLLVTTADHAFLRGEIVDDFCRRAAAAADVDLWVGVVRHQSVQVLFPGLKKTAHKLRGEAWCGCNLFYFASKDSRRAAELWRRAEKDRKRPWRIARTIGWRFLLSFLLGRHSLEQTLDHIGKKLGIRIRALELPFPEASVDVDSVEDWKIVEQLIKNCASASTP